MVVMFLFELQKVATDKLPKLQSALKAPRALYSVCMKHFEVIGWGYKLCLSSSALLYPACYVVSTIKRFSSSWEEVEDLFYQKRSA